MTIMIPMLFLILTLLNFYILIYAICNTCRNKICYIALGLILISFIILNAFTKEYPLFKSLPPVIYINIFLAILVVSIIMLYKENQYEQNTITRTSIKESIDNLPMGLCFSTEKGIILLSNRSMNNLCHSITGRDLQDAEDFWQNIIKNKQEESPILQLDNGQTWSFSRHPISLSSKDGVQISAINITGLAELRSQLKKKNIEFIEMNNRLLQYRENLAHIKSKEERLATKTRLHSDLGYLLLATRGVLANNQFADEGEPILSLWENNIDIFLSGSGIKEKNTFEELLESASDIGIDLFLQGDLPQESKIKDLILISTIEALNNAIRHGDATELNLLIEEKEKNYKIELTNDGRLPEGEITEGGGLSALRGKIEEQGGIMGIDIEHVFKLCIKIPKEKEVNHDKSVDS